MKQLINRFSSASGSVPLLILVLAAGVAMAACGDNAAPAPTTPAPVPAPPPAEPAPPPEPAPIPRECSDEADLALGLAQPTVSEWDGSPFRVDYVNNFPEFVPQEYLQGQLDVIGRLADQIEAQLGYRVIEAGSFVPVPDGAPEGWDQDFDNYWRNDLLPRESGQLLAFYLNDDPGALLGSFHAHVCCGTISYSRPYFEEPHWTQATPPNNPHGEAIVHEIFHLLGFIHEREDFEFGVPMSRGALHVPWESGSEVYYATWEDVDALRCIFPESGR